MTYQPPQYGTQPTSGASHGAPPPGYAPIPPPKKKRKWPWIVGGIVLLGIVGCIGVFTLFVGGAAKVATDLDNNNKGKNAVAGEMNSPATDGKFEFTVTSMKCGAKQVGSDLLNAKAQGQFCQVSVTVKNIADSAETFDGSSQKAYDASEVEYSYDGTASLYVNDQNQTFLEQINPGNQVKGVLVYDVPAGTKLTSIVLHESAFTEGVRIPLK
ncbi:DUF4352 domain-containing protein [Actinoplanes solisilvae]|uniref:DUF4352 domain-containing protein n=1 Tax=Actinoplanes solisilvae TaxID=2486853 RepID=UPI001F0BFB84|nr:DUF4352 domain-containing protein [Actinoplanes solisilvae]